MSRNGQGQQGHLSEFGPLTNVERELQERYRVRQEYYDKLCEQSTPCNCGTSVKVPSDCQWPKHAEVIYGKDGWLPEVIRTGLWVNNRENRARFPEVAPVLRIILDPQTHQWKVRTGYAHSGCRGQGTAFVQDWPHFHSVLRPLRRNGSSNGRSRRRKRK